MISSTFPCTTNQVKELFPAQKVLVLDYCAKANEKLPSSKIKHPKELPDKLRQIGRLIM